MGKKLNEFKGEVYRIYEMNENTPMAFNIQCNSIVTHKFIKYDKKFSYTSVNINVSNPGLDSHLYYSKINEMCCSQ